MTDHAAQRGGLLLPCIAAAGALAVLLGLGVWQVERKAWKEGLIATLDDRLAAPPVVLPPASEWPALKASEDEFRRVRLTVTFLHADEVLVFTAGSSLRPDVSGAGYWVFTPAEIAGGKRILVDRGFVPEARKAPASRAGGKVEGPVEIVGALRWPEQRTYFTPADDPARGNWFTRDPQAVAAAKGLGPVAPFYVAQESPVPPGGLPKPGALRAALPNNHLQYALTWFGLALTLVGVFGAWLTVRLRNRPGG